MPSNLMGIGSLKAQLSNPQRAFLFEVRIPTPQGGGVTSPAIVTVRAEATKIPKRSNTPIKLAYKQTAGIVIKGADTLTHTWKVTFKEGEDAAIYTMVRKWQSR